MLDTYKKAYLSKNIQFIALDPKGVITACDTNLLPCKQGQKLEDLHPFFMSLEGLSLEENEEMIFTCVHLGPEEADRIMDVKATGIKDGLLLTVFDLTQHYNEYQQVAQSRNESVIEQELIVLKNRELEERERFKDQFIRNFSHELRNPLMSIMAITNILKGTKLTEEQQQMLDFLKESNTNLQLMLEDILSISMISSGRLKLEHKAFSFKKLTDLLEFTYKNRAAQRKLGFAMTVDERIPEVVEGDRLRIFQVLTNLLDNALKYTDEGQIGISIALNQKRANRVSLRFTVKDTGPGIPKEKLSQVFESFTRLEGETEVGVGLGLSIVKGLLELMDSSIKVESEVGKGSEFYFDLQLTYPVGSAGISEKELEKAKARPVSGRKYRILMVEDDERVQTVLFKALTDRDNFLIDLVSDGANVLEAVINNSYDLILMDVHLPNTSGEQLTRIIRDLPFDKVNKIPIIGITAHAYKDQVAGYRKSGMNAVLAKPFEQEALLETIGKYLPKS